MTDDEADWKTELERRFEEIQRNAPPRLQIPGRLTPEVLAAVPDHRLDELFLEFVSKKWPADANGDYSWLAGLPEALVNIWATFVVEGEIGNGGFNQFFFNGTDALASPAIDGFAAIGAPEFGDVIAEALALAKNDGSRIVTSWGDASMEAFMESYGQSVFADLDQRFGRLYERKDPGPLRIRWIRSNVDGLISE